MHETFPHTYNKNSKHKDEDERIFFQKGDDFISLIENDIKKLVLENSKRNENEMLIESIYNLYPLEYIDFIFEFEQMMDFKDLASYIANEYCETIKSHITYKTKTFIIFELKYLLAIYIEYNVKKKMKNKI